MDVSGQGTLSYSCKRKLGEFEGEGYGGCKDYAGRSQARVCKASKAAPGVSSFLDNKPFSVPKKIGGAKRLVAICIHDKK